MSLYLKVFFAEDQEDAAIFLIFALPVIGAVVEGMALPPTLRAQCRLSALDRLLLQCRRPEAVFLFFHGGLCYWLCAELTKRRTPWQVAAAAFAGASEVGTP